MKKKKLYWIAGAAIINLLTLLVISPIVLNIMEDNRMKFYTSREEEWMLEEGTYYIYKPPKLHDWYLANDYGDDFYIVDNNPARFYTITTTFYLSGDQEQIKIHSILYEYKTNQLFGSPFAVFEIDESGNYKMNSDIDFSGEAQTFIPKFYISDTHPRTITLWEMTRAISGFLLILSVFSFIGVIYWNMRYEDYVNQSKPADDDSASKWTNKFY
jgi:hypothetical protein